MSRGSPKIIPKQILQQGPNLVQSSLRRLLWKKPKKSSSKMKTGEKLHKNPEIALAMTKFGQKRFERAFMEQAEEIWQ